MDAARRWFLTRVPLALLATPGGVEAQQARTVARIGVLQPGEAPGRYMEALRQGLREFGWVEGHNVVIEHRIAAASTDNAALVTELVNLRVDVLVTWTTPAVTAANRVTGTIPIVAVSGNPVAIGLARSLSRPGGNVTGIAILSDELEVKNLQLLKETVPSASRIAVLSNSGNPLWAAVVKRLNEMAPSLGLKIQSLEVRGPDDLENAFARARKERAEALLVVNDALFGIHGKRVAELAMQYRLPAIYGSVRNLEAGGLLSYAANLSEMLRRAAAYVDRILRGASPGDLPIEQPTKFELVINLKAAKAIGLTIPPSLLLRADQILE